MKLQHELSDEARLGLRQVGTSLHVAIHDAGRMVAIGLTVLAVALVLSSILRGKQ